MSARFLTVCTAALLATLLLTPVSFAQEASEGEWVSLFNGKDLDGWTPKFAGHEFGVNYKDTFRVEDGLLKVSYENYDNGFENAFGHLFYKEPYSHYRIRVEYRFEGEQVEGGPDWAFRNSGVMLHCQDPKSMRVEQAFPVCIEGQLLGGDRTEDRTTANLCTPGTHVVMDGELERQHCINSNSKTYHGDQWVTAEFEVHGAGEIIHYVNGEEVLRYEQPQLDPIDGDANLLIEDGAQLLIDQGYISLQAESHPVAFRKVEIKEIAP